MREDAPHDNPWYEHAAAYAAWVEERGSAGEDDLTARVANLLGDVAGRETLDACCGEGVLARALAVRGARVTGVDVSDRLVASARRKDPAGPIAYRVADLTRPRAGPRRPLREDREQDGTERRARP